MVGQKIAKLSISDVQKLAKRSMSDLWKWFNGSTRKGSNLWTWIDTRAMELPGSIEAIVKETVSDFFEGAYPKKTLFQRMFPFIAGIYAGLLLISWLLFPGVYSLVTNTISDLGNPFKNPSGFWFFSAAFYYLAFAMIPFYQFVHKRLAQLGKILARIGLLSNLVGSGGFIALAAFSNADATISIHLPAAGVSFGGLIVGGLIYWAIIVKDAILKTGTRRIIPIVGALTNVVVGIAVFQLFDFATFSIKPISDITAPWEWTMFFGIAANLLMLMHSIPEIERKASIYRLIEEKKFCAPEDVMRVFANHLPDDGECMDDAQEFCYDK